MRCNVLTTVGAESGLVADRTRLERIASALIVTIDKSHKLGGSIAVEVLDTKEILSCVHVRNQVTAHTGGRNVCDATSQRGEKIKKSARGTPGVFDLAVRTQKIEGSM